VSTIGPAALAVIVVYFAALTWWGTRLLRWLDLPGQTAITLVPLGLIVGIAAQLVIVNAVSHLVPPPTAFPLGLALHAASTIALRLRQPSPLAALPRGAAAVSAALGAIVLVTFAARAFTEFQQDNFREHWLDAATILAGNFPVRHPFDPDEPIRYHYGSALLSAELAWTARVSVLWSNQFLKTALVIAVLALVFGFVCEERRRVAPAFGAWAVVYLYIGLPELLNDVRAGLGASELLRRAGEHGQHNHFFHFPSAALFVQPMAAGVAFALAVIYLLWRRQLALGRVSGAAVLLLLGALALSATPEFIAVLGGLALFCGVTAIGPLRRFGSSRAGALAGVVALALVIASVQGGALTDLWRGPAPGAPAEYGLRWPPGIVTGIDQVLLFASWSWLEHIVIATDGLALLLPVAAFVALRSATPARVFLFTVIVTAFALAHVVSYPSGEFNTNRSLAFALQLALLLVFLAPPSWATAAASRRFALAAIIVVGCTPATRWYSTAVGRALGVRETVEPTYLFWWEDPELRAAAQWIGSVTPAGARIGTNDPMLLVALSGRFAPNGTIDTHGHLHPGLSADPSEWTDASLTRAKLDAVCLFRSPLFQSIDVDPLALAREVRAGGPNVALVAQLLGPNAGALASGSREDATLALNALVRGNPRFSRAVDLRRLSGPPMVRTVLSQGRAPGAPEMPADWMHLNRAALQGMFPAGTRRSWDHSQEISDEHLARYAWYAPLVATSGARAWLTPPAGQGAERVRCLLLERNA
jgi:hypothetical protein